MMGIYEICNLHDGKATAYVGSSKNIELRWTNHKCALRGGYHDNPHLQSAWDKYSEGAFQWSTIEEVLNGSELLRREQHWLDRYLENPSACYNIAETAAIPPSAEGRPVSGATRRKISEAVKACWASGDVYGEEWRRRQGDAQRGKSLSRETRRKLSEINQGKTLSEEHKRKISEAQQGERGHQWGKPLSVAARKKIGDGLAGAYPAFINRATNEVILPGHNLRRLCRGRGLNSSHMHSVRKGKRKSHKGWELL